MSRILNIGLRGLTLIGRFLLIFFLARFLEPAELGLYGLLSATISYALYLLGFDFYTFTTREVLRRERNEWGGLLKSQLGLSAVLYGVFLPLLVLIFVQGLLPWQLAGLFFVLLVLEHLTQELGRLLIAISQQLTASIVLFFRQGAWVVIAVGVMIIKPEWRSLELVLWAWSFGAILALSVGIWRLSQLGMSGWRQKINWRWVISGLRVAIPLLAATLALRGVFTLDRYWFEALNSREELGAYVLFMGFSGALMAFLDAGVFAFSYPSLILAHNQQDSKAFRYGMRKLLVQTLAVSAGFVIAAVIVIGPILGWLDRPLYIEHQNLLHWLLLAMVMYGIGMVPHYGLYAQGKDAPIIGSHICSLVIFVLTTWMASFHWPDLAVPLGLCVAFLLMLGWKTYAYLKVTQLSKANQSS